MGLFSTKRKYYVASQIYNLAGDLNDRPNYIKSAVVQSALADGNITRNLMGHILQGPGFNLRNFYKWANVNYPLGMPTADITYDELTDLSVIQPYIPISSGSPSGTTASIITAVLSEADGSIWAEKYLADNYPELLYEDWVIDQDDVSNVITISFSDHPDITFNPTNWDSSAEYLLVRYFETLPAIEGVEESQGRRGPYLTYDAMNMRSYVSVGGPVSQPSESFSLVQRRHLRVEYKDDIPSTNTVLEDEEITYTYEPEKRVYIWNENKGYIPGTQRRELHIHRREVETRMRKRTTVSRETVEYSDRVEIYTSEIDTLETVYYYDQFIRRDIEYEQLNQSIWIYRLGSGIPELDDLKVRQATLREFFPMLPIRLDNRFIDQNPYINSIYPDIAKAYKKSFNDKIDTMIEELKDNDSINDLDFAYLVFGVILNERDNSGKIYIYEFLKTLMMNQKTNKAEYEGYIKMMKAQAARDVAYHDYQHRSLHRLFDQIPNEVPPLPSYPPPQSTSFVLDTSISGVRDYKQTYTWTYIHETLHSGIAKLDAKKGDLWFEQGPPIEGTSSINRDNYNEKNIHQIARSLFTSTVNRRIYLYWQYDRLKFKRLEIVGFTHSNYVYANKSVITEAYNAIAESSEEAEFFVPIHYPTLQRLSKNNQNQLAMCSRLLVLNTYVVKKVRWYQRGIFKFVAAIAFIGISLIFSGGAGLGAMPGILGANAQVGAALGFATGTMAAAIAGAVANMLVGMILQMVIQKGAIALFGDRWGHLVSAVVGFISIQVGANFKMTGNFNLNWANIFRADNLLKITNVMAKGYMGMLQTDMVRLMEDYEFAEREYKDELKAIQDQWQDVLGSSAWIDPMLFVEELTKPIHDDRESSESFVKRTLLTGSEIAELSLAAISEFPRVSLDLPRVIT